jgi:hypothetical protein
MKARSSKWRRVPAGASASRRLLHWPARNYFAEFEPPMKESHPVDDLMGHDPDLKKIRRSAYQRLRRLQKGADSSALLDFEAERNHLDAARVEAAFNIGFEGGLIAGRAEGIERARRSPPGPDERAFRDEILRTVLTTRARPQDMQAAVLEVAWALALSVPPALATPDASGGPPRRRAAGRRKG